MFHRLTASLRTTFFALIIASLAGGCSAIQKPGVAFKAMNVRDINAEGFTMNFDLDVTNPNAIALPLGDSDYTLKLSGATVVQGNIKPAGTLPAGGAMSVSLPVTMTYENLLKAEKAIVAGGGKVEYALGGNLGFTSDSSASAGGLFSGAKVPLDYSGVLDVKSLLKDPQALLKSDAARKLASRLLTGLHF